VSRGSVLRRSFPRRTRFGGSWRIRAVGSRDWARERRWGARVVELGRGDLALHFLEEFGRDFGGEACRFRCDLGAPGIAGFGLKVT
jgi:hypothetical protein